MFQQEVTIYKVDENTSIGFLPRVYFCNEIYLYRKLRLATKQAQQALGAKHYR